MFDVFRHRGAREVLENSSVISGRRGQHELQHAGDCQSPARRQGERRSSGDCRHGAAGEERGKVDLTPKDVTITVDLSTGPASAVILTTDLTAAYVHENSAYST